MLGVYGKRFGASGWWPGLYPPEVWWVDIPETEVLKNEDFKKGVFTSELQASIHWVLSGATLIMTEREI